MTLSILQLFFLFVVGCLAGFMNVMAGGGSMITMPILRFMGMPGPMANGTNRIAILLQNFTACGSYCRQKAAEPKLSLTLGLCAVPGALIGAYFGTKLEGDMFNYVLAGVMVLVLIYMIVTQRQKKRRAKKQAENASAAQASDRSSPGVLDVQELSRGKSILGHLLMFGVGLYGGFIQAGVGIIIMTCLNGVLDMSLVRANIHKVFIVGIYTVVALSVFGFTGDIYWTAGICLAVGNSLGAIVGTRVNLSGGDRVVRVILYLVIIGMAAKLIFETL